MSQSTNPRLDDLKSRMGPRISAILEGYIKSSSDYVQTLSDTTSARDSMIEAAHSLKSSSAILGLDTVSDASKNLEEHLKNSDTINASDIKPLINVLEAAHKDSVNYVNDEISKL